MTFRFEISVNKRIFVLLYITVFAACVYGGTLSVSPWVLNSDSSISSSRAYTHAVDFGAIYENTSYNGVLFDSVGNYGGVIDGSDYNFSLTSTDSFGDVSPIGSNLESGFSHDIVRDMVYPVNGVATLAISGLKAGGSYSLVLYSIGWENGSRISLIYGDDAAAPESNDQDYLVNQDEYGVGNGLMVTYDYIAPASGELKLYVQNITAGWHFYGFSNESLSLVPIDRSRRVYQNELLRWPNNSPDVILYDLYLGHDYKSVLEADMYSFSDYDKSGIVDLCDFSALTQAWLTPNSKFDLDMTGVVDIGDVAVFSNNWLSDTNPDYIASTDNNYYNTEHLDVFKTYYWRIDEKTAESTNKGEVKTFTVSPTKSVAVGDSSLVSEPLFSDSFTSNSLRGRCHNFAWYIQNSPQSLYIEQSNANPVSWKAEDSSNVYFRNNNAVCSGFGNYGASSGILELNNSSVGILYNQGDDEFVVQFDAILSSVRSNNTSGRLEINCSNSDTAFTGAPDVLSIFLRKVGIFHEISFYTPTYGEKSIMQNINVSDNEWHNYAAAFVKSKGDVEIFIDEKPVISVNFNDIYNGIFASSIADMSVGIGSDTSVIIDNVQIGSLNYVRVNHPEPADGTGADTDVNLKWSGIESGIGYDVYIGNDNNDVSNADADSWYYRGRQTANNYHLSELISGQDYCWRIDQVTRDDIIKGKVWKFSTYGTFMSYDIASPTRIYYIDQGTYQSMSVQEQRLLSMLQGGVAKLKPEIFISLHNDHDALLDDLKTTYGIFTTDVNSVKGSSSALMYLLKKYKNRFDGYVLYDQQANPESMLVAASLAGIYDYLPVDVSLSSYMPIAGLSISLDVRDKDSQWLYDNYWNKFDHDAICIANPDFTYFTRLFDFTIAAGIPLFWNEDPLFNAQLLDSLLPNGIVYGWGNPSIGADWPDEANFVDLYSSNSVCIGPIDAVTNLSVMTGMASYSPEITFSMPNRPQSYQPEADVHYVAFLVGDMDHVLDGVHFTGSDRAYGIPVRGTIPMNWQTPAYMTQLAPASLSWFYRNATGNDHFVDFFSGIYMHPHIHSDLDEFCSQLNRLAIDADQKVTVLSESVPADYYKRLQWIDKVGIKYASMPAIRGYFTYPIQAGDGAIYWIGDKPFINHRYVLMDDDNGVTPPSFALNSAQLANGINAQPADPSVESGYSFVYIANWGHSAYENAIEAVALFDPDVRVVSMEELVERIYINKPE